MSFIGKEFKTKADRPPRAEGELVLSAKPTAQGSGIKSFRTSGSMKALFPSARHVDAIMINTSGGLTGGDRFSTDIGAEPGSQVTITTQAAERAYRASGGTAHIESHISVAGGAQLHWLPQELILFDGAALQRRLTVDLAEAAIFLMVEPVVFGRIAMGERLDQIRFDDRVDIRRNGQPVYSDRVRMDGDAEAHFSHAAIVNGAHAMANVVFAGTGAEAYLKKVRRLLPQTAGASLLADDLLVMRMLAKDGFVLRNFLLPILELLKGGTLPRSWSL